MAAILIATVGSRGDVQPYVALALGLRKAGHDVTIAACDRFAPSITERGLGFAPLSDDILELLDSDAGRAALEDSTGLLGTVKTSIRLARRAGPINEQLMQDVWDAARTAAPDLVIYHPKALAGPHVAEKLGIPAILAVPVPIAVPTGEFPMIGMPRLPLGGWYNRLTYRVARLGYRSYDGKVRAFRQATLGLDGPGHALTTTLPDGQPIEVLYAISAHLVPRPADWPGHAHLTGYWFLDSAESFTPPDELVAFLDSGDPPVYVGFGSMAGRDPARMARIVVEALQRAGVRGILATGWGGLKTGDLPDTVVAITDAPHDWIFPRVAAVVHHGGAGTTAAGLRAGRPTVVCPFILDQFFWGRRGEALGTGPSPIPQQKLTSDKLAEAITQATSDPGIAAAAAAIGCGLRAEDGVANAVGVIAAVLAGGK